MTNDSGGRLAAHGVLLHPGAPKAATTSIQSCLATLRPSLRDQGVLYPGKQMNHIAASRSLLGLSRNTDEAENDTRLWSRTCRAIARHDGRSVVSSEALAICDGSVASRVIGDLGGERVHVVLTLRALDRVVPSAWQEAVKYGCRVPFLDWADAVTSHPGRAGSDDAGRFWTVHDQARFVSTWVDRVGPDRVTVVVIDPSRPDLVFGAFESVIGLAPGTLDPAAATFHNRSLTWPEAEVIRTYNELAGISREFDRVTEIVPPVVVSDMLSTRIPPVDEARLVLPAHQADRLVGISTAGVETIVRSGVHVIGDLDLLVPRVDSAPLSVSPPQSAAFDVAAHVLRAQHEHAQRDRRRRVTSAVQSESGD